MLHGYMRVSKADGSQVTHLQRDAMQVAGVAPERLYVDHATGRQDARPELDACLKALRAGDTLVVWKLDRLARNLRHLVNVAYGLMERGIGLKVLAGAGAVIDTTTPSGRLCFGIFGAFAEFEGELIRERTVAGLAAARARGRHGGRPAKMSAAQVRLAAVAMADARTRVSELCAELGVARQTLYRYVGPDGTLRAAGRKALGERNER